MIRIFVIIARILSQFYGTNHSTFEAKWINKWSFQNYYDFNVMFRII